MLRSLAPSILVLCVSTLAAAQLEGQFHLSKTSYMAGEPVYLVFEVKNMGAKPVMIRTADPLSFCVGYTIEVEEAKRQDSFGCYGAAGGSCASSDEVLNPKGRHIDRILLNQLYDLRQPGTYSLNVRHELPYGPGDADLTMLYTSGTQEIFSAQLQIILESATDSELKDEFQKYLLGLQSVDGRRKIEAAEVIANLAPAFLEKTILQMIDSPGLRDFAVRGLYNLGTPTAHQALVLFVKDSQPTQEAGAYQDAIRYLSQIGDHNDLAMLLQVAHANPPGSYSREVAMESAGEAGSDDAVPLMAKELKDPSIDVRLSAVRALYLTSARSAVPVLIETLALTRRARGRDR